MREIEIKTTTTLESLMHQIVDGYTYEEIIDAIVKMDEEIIQDWDFTTTMYLRYEAMMEQLKEEEEDANQA